MNLTMSAGVFNFPFLTRELSVRRVVFSASVSLSRENQLEINLVVVNLEQLSRVIFSYNLSPSRPDFPVARPQKSLAKSYIFEISSFIN